MLKTIFKGNSLFVFAAFFAIPVVVLFFVLFGNNVDYNYILKNGIKTEATPIEHSESTTTTVNGTEYYSIEYYFYDENNIKHYGETSESFTHVEIYQIIKRGSIVIKYDPMSFESIEADYDESKDTGKNVSIIFLVVFCVVEIVLWYFVVRKAMKNIREVKITNNGQEYTATVTHISTNLMVNGVQMYKVHYTWVGETGETISSASDSVYQIHQAEALERAKRITIKAIGKKSIIMTNPDMCVDRYYNNLENGISDDLEKEKETLKCDYCGHEISSTDEYCGNCGARVNIYK